MSKKIEEEDRSAKVVTDGQRDKLNEQLNVSLTVLHELTIQ